MYQHIWKGCGKLSQRSKYWKYDYLMCCDDPEEAICFLVHNLEITIVINAFSPITNKANHEGTVFNTQIIIEMIISESSYQGRYNFVMVSQKYRSCYVLLFTYKEEHLWQPKE